MTTSVYVNYFSEAKVLKTNVLKPIQVGAARSGHDLGILRDDIGDNISELNPSYCEMTGIYWVWKNDHHSDILGFFHYRRYLDFNTGKPREINSFGMVDYPTLNSSFLDEFGLHEKTIRAVMSDLDMILPEPFDVRSAGQADLRQHYKTAPYHHIEDLELAGTIISELSPETRPVFDEMMSGHLLYPTNIFLFKRPVFERYCAWIFPILERLQREIDTSTYSWQESRAVGYIAERLLTVFILAEKQNNNYLKFNELRRVLVHDTTSEAPEPQLPVTDLPVMTIVASSDSAYVPHLASLIASVFKTSRPGIFIDFIVLDGGLSRGHRKLIDSLTELRADAAISYVDMRLTHLNIPVHSYFARATFYRLSLPDILKHRARILFLDTDMVVVDDLWEVANCDLDSALIAATPDLVMRAFTKMGVPSHELTGGVSTGKYLEEYLKMGDAGRSYFQAGLIVMDLAGIRREGISERLIADLSKNTYWFLDQDVINKHFLGRTKFLDSRWNVVWMDDRHVSALGEEDMEIYSLAHADPGVIHFAGLGKPWANSLNPHSHFYWQFLRYTPYYETILFGYLDQRYHVPAPPAAATGNGLLPVTRRVPNRFSLSVLASKIWRSLPNPVRARIWPLANRIKRALD